MPKYIQNCWQKYELLLTFCYICADIYDSFIIKPEIDNKYEAKQWFGNYKRQMVPLVHAMIGFLP